MGTCGDCKYWDTAGFGMPDRPFGAVPLAKVGKCKLVARHWFPKSPNKMISLSGIEHTQWPVSELISVITRREFGCNQFSSK